MSFSYVAPVLDRTTRSSGRVSVSIDEASFPLGGDPGRRANVTGEVVFQDVEFAPSPLAREVLAIVAPRKEPESLRLDQPVRLSIAEGRVNQRGLAIPIGDVTRIEIDGWVDFDKNLGLVVTLPVTGAMFGNNPLLGEIVSGTKVRVPIGGTLAKPKLDKAEFNAALKDLGKNLLVRGAGVGALELLDRMARPRDPNAPPPPTPEGACGSPAKKAATPPGAAVSDVPMPGGAARPEPCPTPGWRPLVLGGVSVAAFSKERPCVVFSGNVPTRIVRSFHDSGSMRPCWLASGRVTR